MFVHTPTQDNFFPDVLGNVKGKCLRVSLELRDFEVFAEVVPMPCLPTIYSAWSCTYTLTTDTHI
jgi:hypothetical protein